MKQPRRPNSLRLAGYDYAQTGAYFVTAVTQGRLELFGEVVGGVLELNEFGNVAVKTWQGLVRHYDSIVLDTFVVMPNHVHGIIFITQSDTSFANDPVGAGFKPAPTPERRGLSEVVRAFKTFSARTINNLRGTTGVSVWQRGYFDHVIRDEADLENIRTYIATNPLRWQLDRENPARDS